MLKMNILIFGLISGLFLMVNCEDKVNLTANINSFDQVAVRDSDAIELMCHYAVGSGQSLSKLTINFGTDLVYKVEHVNENKTDKVCGTYFKNSTCNIEETKNMAMVSILGISKKKDGKYECAVELKDKNSTNPPPPTLKAGLELFKLEKNIHNVGSILITGHENKDLIKYNKDEAFTILCNATVDDKATYSVSIILNNNPLDKLQINEHNRTENRDNIKTDGYTVAWDNNAPGFQVKVTGQSDKAKGKYLCLYEIDVKAKVTYKIKSADKDIGYNNFSRLCNLSFSLTLISLILIFISSTKY